MENITQYVFKEALSYKNEARITTDPIKASLYNIIASKMFNDLAESISLDSVVDKDEQIILDVEKHYYLYEANDCLYEWNLLRVDFTNAKSKAKIASRYIEKILESIESNYESGNSDTKKYLNGMKKNMVYCQISYKLRSIQPDVKKAMAEERYLEAVDHYQAMIKYEQQACNYAEKEEMPQIYNRIVKGNLNALRSSLSNARAGLLNQKAIKGDLPVDAAAVDSLRCFIEARTYSLAAFQENPENNLYRLGVNRSKESIIEDLKHYRNLWEKFYLEFKDEKGFINIMKEVDSERVKQLENKFGVNEIYNITAQNIIGSQIGTNNTQNIHNRGNNDR